MSDAPKRVPVLLRDGRFGTVDEGDVENLPYGSRVLSKQEEAERAVDERYDALPTGQKVLGGIGAAVGLATGNPLAVGANPDAPPVLAEYGAGVREGLTAGLYDAGERKLIDAVGGKEAGARFAEQRDQEADASPIAHGVGSTVGMVGGAALGEGSQAARALPGAGIPAAGSLVEKGVETALGGLAKRGVLGRAATTAAGMATRGAVEGTLYGVTEQAASDITHDTPITGAKMYAAGGHGALLGGGLGAVLGLGGSLAASGTRAATRGLAKSFLGGVEESATREATAVERPKLELGGRAPEEVPARPEPEGRVESAPEAPRAPEAKPSTEAAPPKATSLADVANAKVGDVAAEQAWKAVGGGFGLQSTHYAKEAAKYFEGGTTDLGKIALKYRIIDMGEAAASPAQAAWTAAKSGTPDAIAPKLQTALDDVGGRIGDITNQSGARVDIADVDRAFAKVRAPYDRIAGNENVTNAIDAYEASLRSKLGATPDGSITVQDLLEQRKGLDQIVYRETKTLDPGRRVEALRGIRSEMESLITEAMDNASGKVPGELRAEYKALKTDYHGLRILSEAAEDSAARASKHATFGFSEKTALFMGLASGHVATAPLLAVGGKVIKERGNAAAAAFLTRAIDQGHVAAVVEAFDARVRRAAGGVLREAASEAGERPAVRQRKSPAETRAQAEQGHADVAATQDKGQAIVKWIGEARGNPAQLMGQLREASALLGQGAGPNAAAAYTAQTLKAIAFVAGYIPVRERRDPLDPRSVPPMTYDDADRLVRAATYATKPETILDDFERGIVTTEGLRAADAFIPPDSMQEFRTELQRHVEYHMMRNRALTQSQRLRIDKLLQYPAGSDLKPAAIAQLQANLTKKGQGGPPPAGQTGSGGPGPVPPPVNMKIQQTGFDAIEARQSS